MSRSALPCLFVVLCVLLASSAALSLNCTVDDSAPLLLYRPPGVWHAKTRSCDQDPLNCSWHEVTNTRLDVLHVNQISLLFNFTGTAVYIYTLPSQSLPNLSFTLDEQPIPFDTDTRSHASVYARRNLPDARHTLQVTVEPESTFLFDYLIYTYETTRTLQIQPRQGDNTDNDNSTEFDAQTSSPSGNDPNQQKSQVGAIAGAIAASIGITSLFSLGLAVSIIKIRRQRLRVRRELEAERERSRGRGLALHLPSASVAARDLPRYPSPSDRPTAVQDPPPYDSVITRATRNPGVLATMGQAGFTAHRPGHLPTIDEVATIRSSRLSRRDPTTREESLNEVPNAPPGLATLTDRPSEETIRPPQERSMRHPSPPARSEHNHQE